MLKKLDFVFTLSDEDLTDRNACVKVKSNLALYKKNQIDFKKLRINFI